MGRKTAEWSGPVTTGTKLASWIYDTAEFGVGLLASTTRFTPTGNYLVGYQYDGAGRVSAHTVRIPTSESGLSGMFRTIYGYTRTGPLTPVRSGHAGRFAG